MVWLALYISIYVDQFALFFVVIVVVVRYSIIQELAVQSSLSERMIVIVFLFATLDLHLGY